MPGVVSLPSVTLHCAEILTSTGPSQVLKASCEYCTIITLPQQLLSLWRFGDGAKTVVFWGGGGFYVEE